MMIGDECGFCSGSGQCTASRGSLPGRGEYFTVDCPRCVGGTIRSLIPTAIARIDAAMDVLGDVKQMLQDNHT